MLQRDVAWKLGNIEGEGQGSVDKILKTQYGYNVYLKNALIIIGSVEILLLIFNQNLI